MSKKIVIAVDGTAGSGKTITFKKVSEILNYEFIDTGLMYRAFTLLCINNKINFESKKEIINQIKFFNYSIKNNQVLLNGIDVELRIQQNDIVKFINFVTPIKEVREFMVNEQRNMVKGGGFIEIGRDITSVVLPNADLKIYLDSSIEARAKRRYEQNKANGILDQNIREIELAIEKRDIQDKQNVLQITPDAWYIDNSHLTIDQVVDMVVKKIKELEVL
ncbi:(d)CMP kinase [Mesoplasma corruscae]|uniref:Cytidylate kinase n=1 Tax=Mesoplasma corruscae TaxID=216874 RepID=A0A2S5RGL6_9MOLU|nr:(d)CMP kinase [Mesoplasma corruscae]PPE06476.1 cytidylate kinase [Mesoplasma corruscae]